jgi:hypothetical protein
MWALRNLAVVAGLGSPRTTLKIFAPSRFTPSDLAFQLEQSFLGWAAAWWVAQTGAELFDRFETSALACIHPTFHANALAGLVALGARHPECRRAARDALRLVDEGGPPTFYTRSAEIALRTLEHIETGDLDAVADPLIRNDGFLYRDLVAPDAKTPDDVPVDAALPWTLASTYNIFASEADFAHFVTLAAKIATLPAEQLCPPREHACHHAARVPGTGALLANLRQTRDFRSLGEPSPPAATVPPRNSRCLCGSGKKYKACCGRTTTVSKR